MTGQRRPTDRFNMFKNCTGRPSLVGKIVLTLNKQMIRSIDRLRKKNVSMIL